MSSGKRALALSLNDLRIAKLGRKRALTPCYSELDEYLTAVARYAGDDRLVPASIAQALQDCVAAKVCSNHSIYLTDIDIVHS